MREAEMLAKLRKGALQLPPLRLKLAAEGTPNGPDAVVEARADRQRYRFALEVKGRSTPKVIEAAITSAQQLARPPKTYPMILVPFLTEAQLRNLEQANVSGLDLNGNGIVVIPHQLLVFRTGQANRYPDSFPIRNVYRGSASLVARVFLLRSRYPSLTEVLREIESRGGSLAISTVSKALKRLEEDLIVARDGGGLRLLQADKLVDRLAEEYERPRVESLRSARAMVPLEKIGVLLSRVARKTSTQVTITGDSSATVYTAMAREDVLRAYCSALDDVFRELERAKALALDATAFANVTLVGTDDAVVHFDHRETKGIPYASPIQSYLELMTGDKRDRETASQLRATILKQTLEKP